MEAVPTVKALDLLRLLAMAGQGWLSAEHYVADLWPQSDHDRSRASLRTAVAQLRKAFGPDVVVRSGDLIGLGDLPVDVTELVDIANRVAAARRECDDTAVVALVQLAQARYGGDLVVSGSSVDAVYAARDELRALRARMLLDGAGAAARQSWMRDSLEFALAASSLDPTEESARALMVAWAGQGETRQVIDTYVRLSKELADTYGVDPSPPTRALYQHLLEATEPGDPLTDEVHLDAVTELAADIRSLQREPEPGGVVWLHGEPGSGRGSVARQARRLVEESASPPVAPVVIVPEVVNLDETEAARLRDEARVAERVLVVPIRRSLWPLSRRDSVVRVGRLDRDQFRELLERLLQNRPSPALEERLWRMTGGLAGRTQRTVARLAREGTLVWTSEGMDMAALAPAAALRPRRDRRGSRGQHSVLAPLLMDVSSWASAGESAFLALVAV